MPLFEELKRACEITGPIGYPDEVNAYLREVWGALGEVTETPIGNVVAHVGGSGPKLLLEAHSDEIGFVVRSISDDGFLWITTAQRQTAPWLGLYDLVLVGQRAMIVGRGGRKVEGLFATVTGHVASSTQREKTRYDYNDVFVDIGARDRDEAMAQGITVGSLAVWNPPTRRLGAAGTLVHGKALDARMGLVIMTEAARRVAPDRRAFDLYLGCSVQEEIGLVGAISLARHADFARAISVEVGLAGDIPLVDRRDMPVSLGQGPVLVYKNAMVHHDRRFTEELAQLAEACSIPYQFAVYPNFGDNAREFIAAGIPSAMITPPTRYTHSPFEMCHIDDVEHTIQLLAAYLEEGKATWPAL